jgi:hypothetical protein
MWGKGVIYLSSLLGRRRLRVSSAFDPFLHFLGIWAISGDMPFLFAMKEAILLALPLPWIFVPISPLAVSFPLIGCLCHILCSYLQHFLPLLVITLLLVVEDLLALVLLLLLLTLVSITPLGIPVACLLLVLIMLF